MRCPYCSESNPDNTKFCIRCGRGLIAPTSKSGRPAQPPRPAQNQPMRPAQPPAGYPAPPRTPSGGPGSPIPSQASLYPPPPNQYTRSAYPPGSGNVSSATVLRPNITPPPIPATAKNAASEASERMRTMIDANVIPSPQTATNDAPGPFPPSTRQQLETLLQGALPYTLVDDTERYGKKKIVRIAYRQCVGWQQVGTLLKALKEYDAPEFDTVVIQGTFEQDKNTYYYTNGQLIFDRNVRLGGLIQLRYQLETGNGLSSDSVRFVIAE